MVDKESPTEAQSERRWSEHLQQLNRPEPRLLGVHHTLADSRTSIIIDQSEATPRRPETPNKRRTVDPLMCPWGLVAGSSMIVLGPWTRANDGLRAGSDHKEHGDGVGGMEQYCM